MSLTRLMVACYAVPARITQGVWMEFQKRLYFAQEDVILNQRRKEAVEEGKYIDDETKQQILKRWEEVKSQSHQNLNDKESEKKDKASPGRMENSS